MGVSLSYVPLANVLTDPREPGVSYPRRGGDDSDIGGVGGIARCVGAVVGGVVRASWAR